MATIQVSNFAELKAAIEDTTSTEITATNDITFSGGIRVNITKSNLTIDFANHTVTDNISGSFTDTIYIASTTNTISVTVKNAIWNGRNYYGVVGVYDGNTNSSITLQNITYTGPQCVYNKNGITNLRDCNITLDKGTGSTAPQEFCEANRVNVFGNVKVTSNSTSNAVIWFTNVNAALTVEENAVFDVTALSTYFLYTDVSPALLFKQGSKTTINTKSGLFYNTSSSSHIAASFLLEENASFVAYKQSANTVPLFKCLSSFSVNKNATFQLFSLASGTAALAYFAQAANITFNSPKNVVLYNNGGNVFSFQTGTTTNPNTININAEMLRLWANATTPISNAGGISDTPTSEYHKAEYLSNLNLTIKNTNSQLISTENNLTTGDVGYPVSTSFPFLTSKVISMGSVSLSAIQPTDISTQIAGTTDTNANLLLEYLSKSESQTADSTGAFSIPLSEQLTKGSTIRLTSNKQFLTKTITLTVQGSLSISRLDALNFYSFVTTPNLEIVKRANPNWSIEVKDTRSDGQNWYVYAYIQNPLTSGSNKLENSLVFKSDDNIQPLSDSPILIHTGAWQADKTLTEISWQENEGFLLQLSPTSTYVQGNYSTNLYVEVLPEPLD